MKIQLFLLFVFVMFCFACEDETLSPTERPEFGYSVPQGDHDYDERIVDWKNRCNVFILYKFDLKELYWGVNNWGESVENPEGSMYPYTAGLLGETADENYVGQQLTLIENSFLNFYPDTTLRRCLPLKLLLCKRLDWRSYKGELTFYPVYSGYDYLAFNWGNENVLTMTDEDVKNFKNKANITFLERLIEKQKIVIPADFYEGSNYTDKITSANMYSRGFLNAATKLEDDAQYYIEAIVTTSYEDLIAETTTGDYSYKGILNPQKDVNGFILKKYNVLVQHMKEAYGIDLQAIGNAK